MWKQCEKTGRRQTQRFFCLLVSVLFFFSGCFHTFIMHQPARLLPLMGIFFFIVLYSTYVGQPVFTFQCPLKITKEYLCQQWQSRIPNADKSTKINCRSIFMLWYKEHHNALYSFCLEKLVSTWVFVLWFIEGTLSRNSCFWNLAFTTWDVFHYEPSL